MKRIRWKRLFAILGTLVLLIVVLAGISIYRGFAGGRPIDYSQTTHANHPIFQGPFNPDQSLDYFAALERVTGAEVPVDQNYCVATLELAPDQGELNPAVRARYAKRIAFDRGSLKRFRSWSQIATEFDLEASTLAQQMSSTAMETFRSDESKTYREVLELQKPALDQLLLELDNRPLYYMPLLTSPDDPQSCIAILLPHAQHQREFARWLTARSNMNLADGNLAEAWQDIRGMYQLANRVSQGFTMVESLVGVFIHNMAAGQMDGLLNHPELSNELIEKIHRQLPEVDSLQSWTVGLDRGERIMMLNSYDLLATGQLQMSPLMQLTASGGSSSSGGLDLIPWGWVDGIRLANDWNAMIDEAIAAAKDPTPGAFEAFHERMVTRLESKPGVPWGLSKALVGAAPTTEATDLAEDLLFGLLTPAMVQVHEACQRQVTNQRLIRLAVAARLLETRTGQLPESLDALQELVQPIDTLDPFTALPFQIERSDDENSPGDWGIVGQSQSQYLIPNKNIVAVRRSRRPTTGPPVGIHCPNKFRINQAAKTGR